MNFKKIIVLFLLLFLLMPMNLLAEETLITSWDENGSMELRGLQNFAEFCTINMTYTDHIINVIDGYIYFNNGQFIYKYSTECNQVFFHDRNDDLYTVGGHLIDNASNNSTFNDVSNSNAARRKKSNGNPEEYYLTDAGEYLDVGERGSLTDDQTDFISVINDSDSPANSVSNDVVNGFPTNWEKGIYNYDDDIYESIVYGFTLDDNNNSYYAGPGFGIVSFDRNGNERWNATTKLDGNPSTADKVPYTKPEYIDYGGGNLFTFANKPLDGSSVDDAFVSDTNYVTKVDPNNGDLLCRKKIGDNNQSWNPSTSDYIYRDQLVVGNNGHAYFLGRKDTNTISIQEIDGNCNTVQENNIYSGHYTNVYDNYELRLFDINNPPTADFTYTPDKIVEGESYSFSDQSSDDGSIQSWEWNFGDGSTSTSQNPSHTYNSAGSYDVKLTVTDDGGLSDSVTKTVEVEEEIVADFTYQNPNPVGFTDASSGSPDTWLWEFGSTGDTSANPNPQYDFPSTGNYDITLTVSNDLQTSSVTKTITVEEAPTADFKTCDGDLVSNYNPACMDGTYSSDPDGSIQSYDWSFGKSGSEVDWYPDKGGFYNVTLTVTDDDGYTDSITKEFSIGVDPLADYDYTPDTILVGDNVSFNNLSSPKHKTDPISNYFWDFDDNDTSNAESPSHTFTSYGNYNVNLSVTVPYDDQPNINSKTSTTGQTLTVYAPPQPDFDTSPNKPNPGDNVDFTDLSNDPDGTIESYEWNFGDNSPIDTSPNPSHTYDDYGKYDVTLTVTDNDGFTRDVTKTVVVLAKPIPDFTYDPQNPFPLVSDTIAFTDQSTDPDGTVTDWVWTFDDPDSTFKTVQNPEFSYDSGGTYTVGLEVTDDDNQSADTEKQIFVGEPPNAKFDYGPDSPVINDGDTINFNNQSFDNDGTIDTNIWNFGDGGSSNQENPSYQYDSAGDYTVNLEVIDNHDLSDSTTQTVTYYARPLADFSYSFDPDDLSDTPTTTDSISFTDNSSDSDGTIESYHWDFDNGDTSSAKDPSYSYSSEGTYNVELKVIDGDGLSDTKTMEITVLAPPVALFTWSPDTPLVDQETKFFDESETGAIQTDFTTMGEEILYREWTFVGLDDNKDTFENPTRVYDSAGVYDVTLMVEDEDGLQDTLTKQIKIEQEPYCNFEVPDDKITIGTTVTFNNTSYDTDGTIEDYFWRFPNGTSMQKDGSYEFNNGGEQLVQLEVTDNDGLTCTVDKNISVQEPLNVDFTSTPDSPVIGEEIEFIDQTTPAPIDWDWTFEGGQVSDDPNPKKSFPTFGEKSVTLEAETNSQSGSATKNITVYAKPTCDFTKSTPVVVTGEEIGFNNQSSDPDGGVVKQFWDLGIKTTNKENPSARYDNGGVYTAKLTVTDNHGFEETCKKDVFVQSAPEADFIASTKTPVQGQAVDFTDLSDDPDGTIKKREWDFTNNGSIDKKGSNPSYSFSDPDTYEVELTVTDNDGHTDKASKKITVSKNIDANFDYSPDNPEPGEAVDFTDQSTVENGVIDSWTWEFGDGGGSNQQDPNLYSYSDENFYPVTLTVIDEFGNQDEITKTIEVTQGISISQAPRRPAVSEPVTFNAINDMDISLKSYTWKFGDGSGQQSGSNLETVSHSYSDDSLNEPDGTYTVELEVEDTNGDTYTTTEDVRVSRRGPGPSP